MSANKINILSCGHSSASFLIGSSSFFHVTRTTIKSGQSSNFGQIGLRAADVAALERIEKSLWTYNGRNVLATLANSYLIVSSSFLQETSTCIKTKMISNFCQISPLTSKLSALERQQKSTYYLVATQSELIVYQSSRRLSVSLLTLSNMTISATSRPN